VVRAADTITWINDQNANFPDKPWFAWLAFNQAHVAVPAPYYHVPNLDTMDAGTAAEITGCGGVPGNSYYANQQDNPQIACTPKQYMRAMTNSMNTVIGKLLDVVDAIPSDTYVIFIGDNGTWSILIDNMYTITSGRGKTTPYESGAWVPMTISGPGIEAGSQSGEFVHAVDLFSTCLELGGLEVATAGLDYLSYQGIPAGLDGVSLAKILFGSDTTLREPDTGYLLTEVRTENQQGKVTTKVGARNAEYKVIREQIPQQFGSNYTNNYYFYDLVSDPLEVMNDYSIFQP
jgi:arylsulfatase A-like enzyme